MDNWWNYQFVCWYSKRQVKRKLGHVVLIRVNVVLNLSYNRHYHVKFNDAARIEILKEIILLEYICDYCGLYM